MTSDALMAGLMEIERHIADLGWDQPARLFALVPTADLIAAEPQLAEHLTHGVEPAAGQLSAIEQDGFAAGADLGEALARISWPATVSGVALGLLTPRGPANPSSHPASAPIREAAQRMAALCASRAADLAFVANQYSIQRSNCATTVIGTSKSHHLRSAVAAAETSLDEALLEELLALRPPVEARTWTSGLPENNVLLTG